MRGLRVLPGLLASFSLLMLGATRAHAQKHEIGLTLGGVVSTDRTASGGIALRQESGTAWQANYAYRLIDLKLAALSVGVHFLANPGRNISSSDSTVPQNLASLYITPDIVLKFLPGAKIEPWLTVGGGYAQYESSDSLLNGSPNQGKIRVHRGALVYGGGIDVPVLRFLALRGEVRDFYTGSPSVNLSLSGGQHNVVAGGGFVLRFGR